MFGSKQRKIDNLAEALARMGHVWTSQYPVTQLLILLVEGCSKHPSYRVVRKPTADCEECNNLYTARVTLNESNAARSIGYVPRTGKRGPNKIKEETIYETQE
jgi:hypothetical protein